MLAVLGFITILLVLALIMSKKVSTLVALIFVPAITGFIAAFINAPNVIIQAAQAAAEKAGTAYVEPVITFGTRFTKALSILSADYMGKGLSSIVATGVMFIFAILFFSTCSDAGVFDPIINRILKFTGEDPVKVCIGTFLIGCICHLDGSGATTFLIAIPACMRSGMLRHGPALVRPPTDSCCPPGRMRISPTRPSCAKPTPGTKRCSRCSSGRRKPCANNGSSWPAKPRPIWRPSAAVTASVPEH